MEYIAISAVVIAGLAWDYGRRAVAANSKRIDQNAEIGYLKKAGLQQSAINDELDRKIEQLELALKNLANRMSEDLTKMQTTVAAATTKISNPRQGLGRMTR